MALPPGFGGGGSARAGFLPLEFERLASTPMKRFEVLQAQNQGERFVDSPELPGLESAGRPPEPLRVDDRRLLDKYACLLPVDGDRRPEARRQGTGRSRGNDDRAQAEEVI